MQKRNLLAACGAAFALAACGGRSDTPATVALAQGLWQGTAGTTTTHSAMVLPDGRAWLVTSDTSTTPATTRLVKATLTGQDGSFTAASAKRYVLDNAGAAPLTVAMSASLVANTSLAGTITGTGVNETYDMAYLSRYDTPAVLADYAGDWTATLGPGVVSWTIDATGALTGTRTTGCTYTGQVSLQTDPKAVVTIAIDENCAGTVSQLAGVAALSADKSRISMFLTSTDESSAALVSLTH